MKCIIQDKRDILLRNMRNKPNSILRSWFESFIFFPCTFSIKLIVLIFQTTSLLVILLKTYEKKLPRLVIL